MREWNLNRPIFINQKFTLRWRKVSIEGNVSTDCFQRAGTCQSHVSWCAAASKTDIQTASRLHRTLKFRLIFCILVNLNTIWSKRKDRWRLVNEEFKWSLICHFYKPIWWWWLRDHYRVVFAFERTLHSRCSVLASIAAYVYVVSFLLYTVHLSIFRILHIRKLNLSFFKSWNSFPKHDVALFVRCFRHFSFIKLWWTLLKYVEFVYAELSPWHQCYLIKTTRHEQLYGGYWPCFLNLSFKWCGWRYSNWLNFLDIGEALWLHRHFISDRILS